MVKIEPIGTGGIVDTLVMSVVIRAPLEQGGYENEGSAYTSSREAKGDVRGAVTALKEDVRDIILDDFMRSRPASSNYLIEVSIRLNRNCILYRVAGEFYCDVYTATIMAVEPCIGF